MKWPAGRELDRAFGPRFPHEFDFTLRFEHIILTIVPKLLFILMAVWYICRLRQQHVRVRLGGLSWTKFAVLGALIAAEIARLGIWCTPSFRSGTAIGASVVSCAATLSLAVLVKIEHSHSLQSSALCGVYLILNMIFDIAKTRSYFLRTMAPLAALSTVGLVFKFILMALLEVPKRREIIDEGVRKTVGKESVAGFWNRVFFVWLNPTFIFGFRNIIRVNDLSALGAEFSSEDLFDRLKNNWDKSKRDSKNALLKACLTTFWLEIFLVVPPRLCFTGFTLAQPLYLRRVVKFIGETDPSMFVRTGLILSCALVFLGLAASRALFGHMNYRLVTMVRGALIPHIIRKTLSVPYSDAKESAAATLMSTDIEGIATGIPSLHEMWACALEVALGLYLLSTMIEQATFLTVLPVMSSVVITYFLGKWYAKGLGVWNGKIQDRVALTTKALLQIKSIKMIGLEGAVSQQIKKSRLAEIASFKSVRVIAGCTVVVAVTTHALSPVLALAGGLFWTTFDGRLNPVDAFTTLAIVMVISYPLNEILHTYPQLMGIAACADRIQSYFVLTEVLQTPDHFSSGDPGYNEQETIEKLPDQRSSNSVIEFRGASIAPAAKAADILNGVSFTIRKSQFTVLLGPVGTGKTTLLRTILGEAVVHGGEVWRKPSHFAYCGQKPWLRNISIRSNVTAFSPWDKPWYDEVVRACCLEDDLQELGEKGDESLAGTNGSNLSGGQRHRVALARAIYSREPVLLLDDVLSGLDIEMSQSIYSRLFGAGGLLRKLDATVIFATHSVGFLKEADQALIFDGSSTIQVQSDPSKISLTNDFVAKLEIEQVPKGANETDSDSESAPILEQDKEIEIKDDLKSRSRGDTSLYKYLMVTISKWKFVVWLLFLITQVLSERFPEVFIRIWLEVDPTNNRYFGGYAAFPVLAFLVTIGVTWIYFMKLVPENGVKLHSSLLDAVLGAKLSFLGSTDTGSIVNRFSQDMTILTQKLPINLYQVAYMGLYVILDTGIIAAGAKYAALLIPFIFAVFYVLQMFYLRTSRQMRYLDIEAKAPLYTLFTETSTPNGLEHIRAFGWQSGFTQECMRAVNFSQMPFYYMYAIQRWLELSMDLIGLFIALVLVCITTVFQHTTTQAALGLSMLNLITFSNNINILLGDWTNFETSLGALARLRTFLSETPQEESRTEDRARSTTDEDSSAPPELPPRWPQKGNVRFTNVNAKYQDAGSLALDDVSLELDAGQKVGITGRSGSGKTSLLLALLGLLEYSGKIEVDGLDLASIPKRVLRSRITTISQDAVLLGGSVRENLVPYEGQSDDSKIDDTLILRTLERVGLSEVISDRGGLEASLSDINLSEGQVQFLCLARAILHHQWTGGKLVLMDEPTSNMDYETEERIHALVGEAFAGCTILTISHRPEAVKDVNVHLEVANGKVAYRVSEPAVPVEEHSDQNS